MRTLLLCAVAAAVVGAAAWFLLSPAQAPVPPGGPSPPAGPVVGPVGGEGSPAGRPVAQAAPPTPPKRPPATARAHAPTGPDVVPVRPLGPPTEGGAGEVPKPNLSPQEQEKLEAVRQKLRDTPFEGIDWRERSLGATVKEIAEKSGVPVVLEGDDLADEPVTARFPHQDGLELLRFVTISRNIRFEVTAEKVIVKR